jgi:hypothetical protein
MQVPTAPGAEHVTQGSLHAPLQQTPSTQKPLRQLLPDWQGAPVSDGSGRPTKPESGAASLMGEGPRPKSRPASTIVGATLPAG